MAFEKIVAEPPSPSDQARRAQRHIEKAQKCLPLGGAYGVPSP